MIKSVVRMKKKNMPIKILVIASFVLMVAVNTLSFLKLFNGKTIADLSSTYPSLITPADYTFSIWIIIYILLFAFATYQLGIWGQQDFENDVLGHARIAFILTSLLNTAWIFAFLYDYLALSAILILGILIVLNWFGKLIRKEYLSFRDEILIRTPFSIYYGWVTIASFINIVILIESIFWESWGFSSTVWTMLLLLLLTVIVIYRTFRNTDFIYCTAVIWAYIGILVKHTHKDALNNRYSSIVILLILAIAILVQCASIVFFYLKKKSKG